MKRTLWVLTVVLVSFALVIPLGIHTAFSRKGLGVLNPSLPVRRTSPAVAFSGNRHRTAKVLAIDTHKARNKHMEGHDNRKEAERVVVFGGSMTVGWLDPRHDSFVHRAFYSRSQATNVDYHYKSYAIPGYTAQRFNQEYPGKFNRILQTQKPQVVVLAWGLENDMSSRYRDSVNTFGHEIQQEIATSLANKSVVLLVTPPVTKLLATRDHRMVELYIRHMFEVGNSFHNPNVVNIDVYHQMMAYMALHHQIYRDYYGNAWHPNEAGHKLAGKILAKDLHADFGSRPILWKPIEPVAE